MAGETEDITARYRIETDKLKADVAELKKQFGLSEAAATESAQKSSKAFNLVGDSIKNIGVALVAAFSVQKIVQFGEECITAFKEAEKNARKLQAAVSANGGLSADFERLLKQSQQLQEIGIFSDDDIQRAQTMALQFGLTSDAVEKLMPTILDFASATGQDLSSAMQSVILGIQGSERALKQYGVQVDSQATRQQNFASIVSQLNSKFEGQAKIVGETASGAAARLKNAFDDLKESIGATLVPLAASATEVANSFIKMFQPLESTQLQKQKDDFNGLTREVLALNVGSKERVEIIKKLQSQYPEFLGNLNAETATNDQLRGALQKVNEQYIFKLAFAKGQETIAPTLQKEADAAAAAAEAQTKLAKEIDKVVEQAMKYPSANNQRIKSDLEYLPVLEQGRQLAESRIKFDAISSSSLEGLAGAYTDAKQKQIEYASASIKSTDAQKEFNKTVEELKNIFGIKDPEKNKPVKTGLEGETDEERDRRLAKEAKAAQDRQKQEEEENKFLEGLRDENLKNAEDAVQKETAVRIEGLQGRNLTEQGLEQQMTLIEIDELTKQLDVFENFGKNTGEILVRLALAHQKLIDQMKSKLKPEDVHPNADDFKDFEKFLKTTDDDLKKVIASKIEMMHQLTEGFLGVANSFNQINQDSLTRQSDDNQKQFDADEEALQSKLDQRLIGQDEYEKKLQDIKNRREGNQRALDNRMRVLRNRQALFEKAHAIFQIGLDTRAAIMNIEKLWAGNPIVATVLTIATIALAAGQLAAAVALQPPTAHEGERSVTRKGDNRGLKSDETYRVLRVGERVTREDINRSHGEVFDAIEEGNLDKYIYHKYVTPALMAQKKRQESAASKSFAENVAASMMFSSDGALGSVSEASFQRLWNRGIKIRNVKDFAKFFNQSSDNPYRKI